MNDRDLWEMDADEVEQHLLSLGRSERAPGASRRLALAAVASAGAGLTATASAAASAAVAGRTGWLVVKWLALGVTSGALVAGAVSGAHGLLIGRSAPMASARQVTAVTSPKRVSERAAAVGSVQEESVAPRSAAPSVGPSAASHTAPVRTALSGAKSKESSSPPPSTELPSVMAGSNGSLRAELDLLEQARRALDAYAPLNALAALARYDQRFPAGRLRIEAIALRIETEFASGQAETGQSMARAFLAEYPRSPAALRVRRLADSRTPSNQ